MGMEQAMAKTTNRDHPRAANQAPEGVVALRNGSGLGARNVTRMPLE
jgi:hypothetical protein